MKNIDIHSHLNFKDFSEDQDEVIQRALNNGVGMINIGTNLHTSAESVRLANQYDGLYSIIGLHPIYVDDEEFDVEKYRELLKDSNVVGIGETGLDYFHIEGDVVVAKAKQEEVFRKQIELAIEFDKPIMIHCRDAYSDLLNILKEYEERGLRGNVHFFAGTKDQAKHFIDLGFTISFTGVITFAKQYEELVEFVPLDKMHAETDCPYVAPVPYRGQRNEPLYVLEVVKKIAEIKGLSVEEVSDQLWKNAEELFGVK